MSSPSHPSPGEIFCEPGSLMLNADRDCVTLTVVSVGDRPIQVGSHYHFFEVNRALQFDRAAAFGFRLDIPAGTAVRFEPGDTKDVMLVALAGNRHVHGLNSLVDDALDAPQAKATAVARVQAQGYGMTTPEGEDGN